ncbi:MAG TPA: alkaline phosphatase family protein [Polyangiaceae bacterium]|nr:alkaline phosphatase family protein [Polyangiaceae bacterium]
MQRCSSALGPSLRLGLAISIALASACDSSRPAPSAAAPAAPSSVAAKASPLAQSAPAAPRVVVALVFDQLGSDTLRSHLDLLDPKGAIRRAVDSGVFLERSAYAYANTLTAPGHVTVHTGAPPISSGIEGNSIWDTAHARALGVVDDPARLVFGREADGLGASPTRLRVPTVAHALRIATSGAAKIISLSLKDRSAILSVGTAADLVLWYDTKLGAFTSSPVWGPALPEWLARYQQAHPIRELLVPWTAERPDEYRARLGADAAPGEGDLAGFGVTFPHGFEAVATPLSVLSCTPMLSEYLVALTETAAREQHLAEDAVPDLIALSISGTDSAGHIFGPGSWEYWDHLIRADRAVGAWLSRLEQSGPIAVLITSDHGASPLPETRQAPAGRLSPPALQRRLEQALATHYGAGPWVSGILTPFVYLSEAARRHPARAQLLDVARAALLEDPALRDAWALDRVRAFGDGDPTERALRLSVAPDDEADLMFLARPYYPIDLRDPPQRGTNHGTPYDYDRQVPVLAFGAGVPHRRSAEPVDQMRVAATLAHLLGIAPPPSAAPGALF